MTTSAIKSLYLRKIFSQNYFAKGILRNYLFFLSFSFFRERNYEKCSLRFFTLQGTTQRRTRKWLSGIYREKVLKIPVQGFDFFMKLLACNLTKNDLLQRDSSKILPTFFIFNLSITSSFGSGLN